MRMGHQDCFDGSSANGAEQRAIVGLVIGAGIDDRQRLFSDNVCVGAVEGVRAGIVGGYPRDVMAEIDRLAVRGRKIHSKLR